MRIPSTAYFLFVHLIKHPEHMAFLKHFSSVPLHLVTHV